jgi:hypothetical protein
LGDVVPLLHVNSSSSAARGVDSVASIVEATSKVNILLAPTPAHFRCQSIRIARGAPITLFIIIARWQEQALEVLCVPAGRWSLAGHTGPAGHRRNHVPGLTASPAVCKQMHHQIPSGYYSDVQKSVPVKLARLLPCITIGCCFDSHPRIDSVLQRPEIALRTSGERYKQRALR